MIVVADTSPIRYLIEIELAHVLPALYGRVIVPPAVVAELSHERTPLMVHRWINDKPDWFQVQAPKKPAPVSAALGHGEGDAIALAEELSADAILIDDRDGRKEAARRGLPVVGRFRVLADAAQGSLVDLQAAFDRLRLTNFRADESLLNQLLALDQERRR